MATEIEVEIMIGKDKNFKPRIDAKIITEEVIIDKTLVEVTVEIEAGKTLGEIIIIVTENRSKRKKPHTQKVY